MKVMLCVAHFLLSASGIAHAQMEGYSVQRDRYVVSRKVDWEVWRFPKGALRIAENGRVLPLYVRKSTNAVSNAKEFVHQIPGEILLDFPFRTEWEKGMGVYGTFYLASGGIKNAGSNLSDAWLAIDGDTATYWEASLNDGLEDWWIEVDLGRLVAATKVVVTFADERMGDRFSEFKVSTSKGEPAYQGTDRLGWKQVYRCRSPSSTQRRFEIPLDTPPDTEGEGDEIQYVRVQATARTELGAEVTREEYELLPEELRGGKTYYKRTEAGEERPISEQGYRILPLKEQGRIRYYKRPLARLAEIEVWSVGDNIALGILEREGNVDNPATSRLPEYRSIVDGSWRTYRKVVPQLGISRSIQLDLGATFWVDTVRLLCSRVTMDRGIVSRSIGSYRIDGSDGTPAPDGNLVWEQLSPDERLNMPEGMWRTEDRFESRKVRFLDVQIHTTYIYTGYEAHFLHEVEIYGEGYAPEIRMESPLIRLGSDRALDKVYWQGQEPPGTALEVRTRTGNTLKTIERYFDIDGNEISEARWRRLPGFLQMAPVLEQVPGDDWSSWARPYRSSGDRVTSPSPARYLQIQVGLLSDDPSAAARIEELSVNTFTALVQKTVGEIAPRQVDRAGDSQEFSCFIRCRATLESLGFDRILITCPYKDVSLSFVDLLWGTEDDFRTQTPERPQVYVVSSGSDSLWIVFPEVLRPVHRNLFEIRFRSTVFLESTPFYVFLHNPALPNVHQWVWAGDATSLVDTDRLQVSVPRGRRILGDVEIGPNPFTPNGDGTNDEMEISFTVYKLEADRSVRIEIFDLSGRCVRALSERRPNVSGRHCVVWNGKDESNCPVSPGIYLIRIVTRPDWKDAEKVEVWRTVGVAY